MNKPSERIVVFVTTAQKRAIAASAENLGISVSELMRRAVLSFGATSEQVKAASIIDRLRAPRAPDALDAALQRVAHGTRHARAALPPVLQTRDARGEASSAMQSTAESTEFAPPVNESPAASSAYGGAAPAPLLPAGVAAALAAETDAEAEATAEAVARVAAARAAAAAAASVATTQGSAPQQPDSEAQLRSVFKRPRIDTSRDEDDPRNDPSTKGSRFA